MDGTNAPERPRTALVLTLASVGGSLVMAIVLVVVHVAYGSMLALAQAADSASDMLAGGVLLWAMRQSARPPDAEHPHGHSRAEPIAALIVAVLAGVLAIEVLRAAVMAIAVGAEPELDLPLALAFTAKVVFKGTIVLVAMNMARRHSNPALDALRIDARNDVLVGTVAVIGFVVARAGLPSIDAGLAIAVSIYVGWSALRLARENVERLMGTAASVERQRALEAIAAAVPGVTRVDELVATYYGSDLHVHVDVTVDAALTLREAHAIGHAVEARLVGEHDVERAIAHVQPPE